MLYMMLQIYLSQALHSVQKPTNLVLVVLARVLSNIYYVCIASSIEDRGFSDIGELERYSQKTLVVSLPSVLTPCRYRFYSGYPDNRYDAMASNFSL